MHKYFDTLNRLGVNHQCDGQTSRQPDRIAIAIACVCRRALTTGKPVLTEHRINLDFVIFSLTIQLN